MPRPFSILSRPPSRLIALATVVAAIAAAPVAHAEADYEWAGGAHSRWSEKNWYEVGSNQLTKIDLGYSTYLNFGRSNGGNTTLNDDLGTGGVRFLGFSYQNWQLSGSQLNFDQNGSLNVFTAQGAGINVKIANDIHLLTDFNHDQTSLPLIVDAGSTLTLTGHLDNDGGIDKRGDGNLTLGGFHNYTGNTVVSAGRVIDYFPQGNYVNNANLEFQTNASQTFGGSISGSGTFTKSGGGTVDLTGSLGYTGATIVNAGILIVQVPKSSSVTVAGSSIFEARMNQTFTYAGTISGTGTFIKSGMGTLTRSGASDFAGLTELRAGALIDLHPHGDYSNATTLTFNVADTQTYAGQIYGSGTLNKTGAGTLTHSGSNFSSGITNVQAGRLIDLYPSFGDYNVSSNAVLEIQTATRDGYDRRIDGAGSFTKSGAGILTLNGVNTYTGGTTVSAGRLIDQHPHGDYVTNADLEFRNATNVDFSTPVPVGPPSPNTISGTGSLTKNGAGTLTLWGPLTYAGATTIDGGTLYAIGNDLLPRGTALTVGARGTLLAAGTQMVASLSGAGSVVAGGALTVSGAASTTFSGVISANGPLVKAGAGTLTLTGVNTYTRGTTVSGGRLIDANPHGSYVTNAALEFRTAADLTYGTAITGTGSFTKSGAGTLTLSGANAYTGGTTVESGLLIDLRPHGDYVTNAVLEFAGGADAAYGGAVDGTGTFVKSGAGTLTLTGSIKPGVTTKIEGGTLKGPGGGLQGDVVGAAGTAFQPTGAFAAGFSGAGSLRVVDGVLTMAKAPANTGGVGLSSGELRIDAAGAFGGGLTVDARSRFSNGSGGTLTVGGTSVNQGTVETRPGSTTVFAGPVSGAGSFTRSGTVEFDGGYSPGNSPASIAFGGGLRLGAGNDLTMELGGLVPGTGYDRLAVGGRLDFGGRLSLVSLNGFSLALGQSFDLFDFGSSSGRFSSIALPVLGQGLSWNTSALYTSGVIRVQSVPEPTSMAALGLGAVAVLRRRRKA